MPSRATRIRSLDGLRALAIAAVVCAHGSGTGWYCSARGSVVLADLGVRAFFVLSGFLITSLLVDERARTRAISLRGFYARRALRIVPALAVYLAIAWLALGAPAHDVGVAASFTMNFHGDRSWLVGHTWSLGVEEQFYVLWPAIVAFATFAGGRNAALAALVIGPIARLALWYAAPEYRAISDQAFPCVADALATGCLVALLRERLAWSTTWNALGSPTGSGRPRCSRCAAASSAPRGSLSASLRRCPTSRSAR